MRSLNRVMLIGHLAADVDFRETKSGIKVANFPIATNHVIRDKDGKKRESVDFHRIVAWKQLAEICNEYLSKGTAVYLDGRLVNHSFEDKEGNRHYRTEIIAEGINILTWSKDRSGQEAVGIQPISEEELDDSTQDEVEEIAVVA
jgi:single-strand DNA-binding protein